MKAAVSGRAAAALVQDGARWYRFTPADSEPRKAGPHEWPFVFGVAEDVQYFEAHSLDEVRGVLRAAVDEDNAVSVALICLDITTRPATRNVAGSDLEEIVARTPSALKHLWRVFTSKPLPYDSSIYDAYEVTTSEARRFFARLNEHQPAITRVRLAWEILPRAVFGSLHADEVYAYAVHAGICAELVDAVHQSRAVAMPAELDVPDYWKTADIVRILTAWTHSITALSAPPARMVVLEREDYAQTPEEVAHEPVTFFAAPDPDLEGLQQIDFDGSLINNILLRRRLLIPDTYVYKSSGIQQHLLKGENSLLEQGIAAGLVGAAVQYRDVDFDAGYQILRRTREITTPCTYIKRLQDAADQSTDVFVFAPDVKGQFDKYLSVLQADEPPATAAQAGASALGKAWAATREWRKGVIDRAREATLRHHGIGVDKRELFRSFVTEVMGGPAPEIQSIRDLLDRVPQDLKRQVRLFWSWVAEGARFSNAHLQEAQMYSPGYEALQNLFVTSALIPLKGGDNVSARVEMPETDALKCVPPQELIALRLGPGAEYLKSLEQWHKGGQDRDKQVQEALNAYASEISKVCVKYVPNMTMKTVEMNIGTPERHLSIKGDRQQFASMTTFDSPYDKFVHGVLGVGRVGPVRRNDRTDVCIVSTRPI